MLRVRALRPITSPERENGVIACPWMRQLHYSHATVECNFRHDRDGGRPARFLWKERLVRRSEPEFEARQKLPRAWHRSLPRFWETVCRWSTCCFSNRSQRSRSAEDQACYELIVVPFGRGRVVLDLMQQGIEGNLGQIVLRHLNRSQRRNSELS